MSKERRIPFCHSDLFKVVADKSPVVIIDVGARGGLSGTWEPLRGLMRGIGFEPDEDECRRLNGATGANVSYVPTALSNKKHEAALYVTRKASCCSLLEPNSAFVDRFLNSEDFEVTEVISVSCDTLDNVVQTEGIEDIDFIKLDTQGSELWVLEGADRVLAEFCVFGIRVEVEFSPLYKNQPLFVDVDTYLRERGFALFDIRARLGRKVRRTAPAGSGSFQGQGLWSYALYFRDFATDLGACLNTIDSAKAMKTVALAEFFGFGDYALELLDLYQEKGIIGEAVREESRKMLLAAQTARQHRHGPEHRLCVSLRDNAGEYLSSRSPFLYRQLARLIAGSRSQ